MKNLKIAAIVLVSLMIMAPGLKAAANEDAVTTTGETASEFGSCGADPIYEKSVNGIMKISANLRSVACMTDSKVLRVIPQGKVVKIIGSTDGWYKIKDSDGTTGWVGSTLIAETEASTTVSDTKTSTTAETSVQTSTASSNFVKPLKGYILLQVEQRGEAWYVNPEDSYRYFLKDGDTALKVMKEMGLGISNANLEKLKTGAADLVNRLRGRIVLQVEKNGEAYYVSPKDGSLTYMRNGVEAFNVMRKQGLGITNENIKKVVNKTVEEYKQIKSQIKESLTAEPADNVNGSMTLSATLTSDNKVNLNWNLKDMTSSQGFKIVVSENENPVYPGNDYHYLSDPNVRSDVWTGLKAGKYYFRVCEYLGGKCGKYSNNASVTIAETTSNTGGTITLTGAVNAEGIATLNWTLAGMTSSMGFKVVVADHENPVYPGDTYHYYTDPNLRTDSWSDLKTGTYYFRVCEYLGGKCGKYSNNLRLEL